MLRTFEEVEVRRIASLFDSLCLSQRCLAMRLVCAPDGKPCAIHVVCSRCSGATFVDLVQFQNLGRCGTDFKCYMLPYPVVIITRVHYLGPPGPSTS